MCRTGARPSERLQCGAQEMIVAEVAGKVRPPTVGCCLCGATPANLTSYL